MTPFPTPPPLTRTWLLGLSAVTLLALGVRLPVIGAHSFWYDEAVTQQLIRKPTHDILNGSARDNGNPPLYLLAARGWQQAVGPGDDGLRGFSLLCSVATVAALGALGRRLGGPAVGLAAAALYAASPLSVEFAHEARTYALLHLLAVVNVWWFVLALSHDRPWDWAGYAATMFLAWYSHYYAAFLPLSHVLVLAVLPWRSRRWLAWAAATGAASVAWATWLPTF
ncbi:glycosyltransferase family 39 protein, partial [bacterium]|nr:glycosyltransferase family 39 protein [bacterium]